MSLLNFPNELILESSKSLSPADMSSLLRTNRRFSRLLSEPLLNAVLRDPFGQYGRAALYSAAHHQDKDTVKKLMKAGLVDYGNDKSPHAQPILHDVILTRGEKAAITMLECGANPELVSVSPPKSPKAVHLAIMRGYENLVRALLGNDQADVNWEAEFVGTPLDVAIDKGNETLVQLLLQDPRVTVGKNEPLMRAARGGNEGIVGLLIEDGRVDVNSLDEFGRVALYAAASRGYEKVIRLLLAVEGININQRDPAGWTPLHRAVNELHSGAVRALLSDDRVDVNAQGGSGWRALHVAAGRPECEVAQILLDDPRVDLNSLKDDGETPLHVAARFDALWAVRLLLSQDGIMLDIENIRGDSVRELAERGRYVPEINEAILSHGGSGVKEEKIAH